jgi:hypothetical protein
MRKLILISAFVSASILASVSVQAQSVGANEAVESASPEGAMAKPQGAGKQASKPSKSRTTRRENDEAKARRIAAKYGVSW